MFNKILEIYIGVITNFSVSIGKGGKFIPKYLPPNDYEFILLTYPDHNSENIVRSMKIMCKIFGLYARRIASQLQFTYNKEEENNAIQYFDRIMNDYN